MAINSGTCPGGTTSIFTRFALHFECLRWHIKNLGQSVKIYYSCARLLLMKRISLQHSSRCCNVPMLCSLNSLVHFSQHNQYYIGLWKFQGRKKMTTQRHLICSCLCTMFLQFNKILPHKCLFKCRSYYQNTQMVNYDHKETCNQGLE